MKGFTLVETLLYIALSTAITTSLLSCIFLFIDLERTTSSTINAEIRGVYWLQNLSYDPIKDIPEENFIYTASSTLHSYFFTIENLPFTVTYFHEIP
jgi:hypothetical protein